MNDHSIRDAVAEDAEELSHLMDQLGYPGTDEFMVSRLPELLAHPDARVWVAEQDGRLHGVLAVHAIPQLGTAGAFLRIAYFCVAGGKRGSGIGKTLLAKAEDLAADLGCDRLEVHCAARRANALAFYREHSFEDAPKYLIKKVAAKASG